MKKFAALALAGCMAVSLAACGGFRLHFHRCFGVHGSRRVHLCCRVCC